MSNCFLFYFSHSFIFVCSNECKTNAKHPPSVTDSHYNSRYSQLFALAFSFRWLCHCYCYCISVWFSFDWLFFSLRSVSLTRSLAHSLSQFLSSVHTPRFFSTFNCVQLNHVYNTNISFEHILFLHLNKGRILSYSANTLLYNYVSF